MNAAPLPHRLAAALGAASMTALILVAISATADGFVASARARELGPGAASTVAQTAAARSAVQCRAVPG